MSGTRRVTGRITRVIRARACGFIRAADGQDVFFHASELVGIRFDALEDGLVVRFTIIRDPVSGPRAARVRIDRGPVEREEPPGIAGQADRS